MSIFDKGGVFMFSAITISLRIANWLNWLFDALLMVTLSAIVGDWAGLGTMVFTRIEPRHHA